MDASNDKTLKFPGTDQDITLKVLSLTERQEAVFAAEQHFKKKGHELSLATADAFAAETVMQILFRALRDPQDIASPIAANADEFREFVTATEQEALAEEYFALEKEGISE